MKVEELSKDSPGTLIFPSIQEREVYVFIKEVNRKGYFFHKGDIIIIKVVTSSTYRIKDRSSNMSYSVPREVFSYYIISGAMEKLIHMREELL